MRKSRACQMAQRGAGEKKNGKGTKQTEEGSGTRRKNGVVTVLNPAPHRKNVWSGERTTPLILTSVPRENECVGFIIR